MLLLLLACAGPPSAGEGPGRAVPDGTPARDLSILAVNDTYRIDGLPDGRGGIARLRAVRRQLEAEEPDLLVLHAGDLLFPSLMSKHFGGAHMIEALNALDGDPDAFDARLLVTVGNHDLEGDLDTFRARLAESRFTWLAANLRFDPPIDAPNLKPSVLVEAGGRTIGVFGVTIDDKKPPYVAEFLPPIETAREWTAKLRAQGADVVIALTHLDLSEDLALLEALGADGPDLVVGGHDHEHQAAQVGGRWVLKADADAVTATHIRHGTTTSHDWIRLDGAPDPDVLAIAERRRAAFDAAFCEESPGCLDVALATCETELRAEELEIRKYETSLGNWVADEMRRAFPTADGAFVNAGSLRLNHDLPAGHTLTRRDVEELLPYDNPVMLVEIDGATLQRIVSHAVTDWRGNGRWLQISGFAFRHDPEAGTATQLTRDGRPVAPDERLKLATVGFLVDPARGQDGYTMLRADQVVGEAGDLRALLLDALRREGTIRPVVEGRICNPQRPGPCLAVAR